MAKTNNMTVERVLSVVETGLIGEDLQAFTAYINCEIGALKADMKDDVFGGLVLKGKGDKAKGVFNAGRLDFNGGHNPATLVIHFACLIHKQADSLESFRLQLIALLYAQRGLSVGRSKVTPMFQGKLHKLLSL